MKQCTFISDIASRETMETFIEDVSGISTTLLSGIGYSGSTLERVDVETLSGLKQSFILKRTNLDTDWISQRTNDTIGREAAILAESSLMKIWEHIHCPYLAFAIEEGQVAMLMNDLSPYLFPDVREPIDVKTEATILNTLAALHAAFWESTELKEINWLMNLDRYLEILSAGKHATDLFAPPPDQLLAGMTKGWALALDLLPEAIKFMFLRPAEEILVQWKGLPSTLLHGDAKLSNMALMPGGHLALFDWAMAGHGPCSLDLGWYIAVNATRLAGSKEEVMATYRTFLESHLHHPIKERTWTAIVDLAIFAGAKMLLWNKALGHHAGTERGKAEWDWWIQQLQVVLSHSR